MKNNYLASENQLFCFFLVKEISSAFFPENDFSGGWWSRVCRKVSSQTQTNLYSFFKID